MPILRRFATASLLLGLSLILSACDSAEERAEKHFQDALELIEAGDTDRAIVELRNVFSLNGSHIEARTVMADLLLQRGDKVGAYRNYLFLAEQDPDVVEPRIILSEMAFLGGNWDEVERHGARVAELAPENPRVQIISLVRAYHAATLIRDLAELRRLGLEADALLADYPDNPLLHNVMVDHAIREKDFDRALAEVDWVIAYDPENSRNYKERLRVLAQLGDMAGFEAQLRELVVLFPDDPSHKETVIRFYLSRQDLDAAESFLRELVASAEPQETQPTLDLIRFLVELRSPQAAMAELQNVVATHPDPTAFKTLAASLAFSQGQQDKAIADLEALLQDAEPSEQITHARVVLAQMLLATRNEVGARALTEEVLAENPTHPGALKLKAAWQIEADEIDAALGGLRMALDQAPQDAATMSLMANAYLRAGQQELARDFLALAAEASNNAPAESLRFARFLINEESYLPAEDTLLSALRLDRTNLEILGILGELYLRMEDFGRAQGVADALRRIGSERAVLAANGIEAERLNRQRGVDEALAFLETLSDAEDATLGTRVALVQAQISVGDITGAIALANELKQENPDNESLDIVLAVVLSLSGDLETAIALYEGLLATEKARPSIWLELSRLKRRQGAYDEAKAIVDEGLSHTPDAPNLLWAKASFLEQDGNIDAAIDIYDQLYEQDSNSLVIANNLASLLTTYRADESSLDRAWAIARRLRNTEAPALQDTYGWLLHRRGDTVEALPYLERAAEALPGEPLVQYHLSQVYLALGRSQEALEKLREAVDLAGPADLRPQMETARAQIQSLQTTGSVEGMTEGAVEN